MKPPLGGAVPTTMQKADQPPAAGVRATAPVAAEPATMMLATLP